MDELKGQMEKLTVRVEKAEKGRKDAEREGAEARRQRKFCHPTYLSCHVAGADMCMPINDHTDIVALYAWHSITVATVQRELDAEVAHSKQLAAETGRRPAAAALGPTSGSKGSSSQGKNKAGSGGGPGAFEMEKKLELFEGLTGLVIVSYVETIRQPGDVKAIMFTCVFSVDNKGLSVSFRFKSAIRSLPFQNSHSS